MRRKAASFLKSVGVAAGVLIVLYLLFWLVLSLGGAKFALERGLSAAMNGYLTAEQASYRPFGTFTARDVKIVLVLDGFQQRVITIDRIRAVPVLRFLPWGRMHFDSVEVDGLALELTMMPNRQINIARLFPKREDGDGLRVFPPDCIDVRGFRISVAPYTSNPIPFERIRANFKRVAEMRTSGIATIKSELLGNGTAFINLNLGTGEYHVRFNTSTIVLDRQFMERLPVLPDEDIVRMILPQGRFAVEVFAAGWKEKEHRLEATIRLQGLDVHSLQFPLAITGATGEISYDGKNVVLRNFSCLVPMATASAALRVNAELLDDGSMQANFDIVDLELTDRFLFFLPQTEELLDQVSIDGLANLAATVVHRPDWVIPRVNGSFTFSGEIMPLDFPIPVSEIRATLRTDERGLAFIDDLTCIVGEGATRSRLEAAGMFDPGGKAFNLLVSSDSFYITDTLIQQIPMVPDAVTGNIGVVGRMAVGGEMIHSPEGTVIDARASLDDLIVSLLRYPEIALSNVRGVITFSQQRLAVDNLLARLLTGNVLLALAADISEGEESFEGRLMLRDIDIGLLPYELTERKMAGLVDLTLAFSADAPELQALRAQGEFALRDGRLIELPLVVAIITAIDLRPPEPPVFRAASGRFRIENGLLRIRRLELLSEQLILFASGDIGFDGRLNLRASLGVRQPLFEGLPLVGPIIGVLTGMVRSALTTVIVTGTLEEPQIELEAIRTLLLPLTAVLDIFDVGGGRDAVLQ